MTRKQGDLAEMVALIEQTAVEVAAQEEQIRRGLVNLIERERTHDAIEILQAWDCMAPGDVLKKYSALTDGIQD